MGYLGPRISHPASKLWIRCSDWFIILHNERGQERHGSYINGFSESLIHSNLVILEQKMVSRPLNFESALRFFLLILHNKRDQEVHENFISCFLRKNLIWGNLIFSGHFLMLDWVWSKLSQVNVSIGSLKRQDMIHILKQSGYYFPVNVYVVDTVLRYHVMFMYGGHYST